MGFLGDIFTGNSGTQTGDINNAGNIMGFGTSVGEGDIGAASGFENTLLGGNQAAEAKLLAPQIQGIQERGQQQMQTQGEFGNRSGGVNASNQRNIDTQRAAVNDMISQLTGGAATNLANIGQGALNTGLSANALQNQEEQQRLQNEQQSIFGAGMKDFAQTGLNAAEGWMGF